jgi:hypothetical protein
MRAFSPTRFTARHAGSIFITIVVLVFIRAGFFAGHNNPDSTLYHALKHSSKHPGWLSRLPSDNQRAVTQHPIPKLMEDAELEFKQKLSSQSRTLKAAVTEYKRRYKRDPPKGFDEWFKFTQQNNVKIIDEYDGLMQDMEPFWSLSGEEIRRRSRQVRSNHLHLHTFSSLPFRLLSFLLSTWYALKAAWQRRSKCLKTFLTMKKRMSEQKASYAWWNTLPQRL